MAPKQTANDTQFEATIKKAIRDLSKANFDARDAYDPPTDPAQKEVYDDILQLTGQLDPLDPPEPAA